MAVKFTGLTKHGTLVFAPGAKLGFEDDNAEDYFIKMGWAEDAGPDDQADFVYPAGSVEIDPKTVFADGPSKGQFVLPELAAKADEPAATAESEA